MLIDPEQIIREELGINSPEDYEKFVTKLLVEGVTDEDVERLNPDKIDNVKLWQLAEKFDHISMCGGGLVDDNSKKEHINFFNKKLIIQSGITDYLALDTRPNKKILEIGPGYGSLYEMISRAPTETELEYTGIDVIPRFEKVVACDGTGKFPEEVLNKQFEYVISSNVFQHLSVNQMKSYINESYDVLVDGGYLFIGMGTTCPYGSRLCHKVTKRQYCITCGQLVPLVDSLNELSFKDKFRLLQANYRNDGYTVYFFKKV